MTTKIKTSSTVTVELDRADLIRAAKAKGFAPPAGVEVEIIARGNYDSYRDTRPEVHVDEEPLEVVWTEESESEIGTPEEATEILRAQNRCLKCMKPLEHCECE